jgi:hypothetical protein
LPNGETGEMERVLLKESTVTESREEIEVSVKEGIDSANNDVSGLFAETQWLI